MTRNRIAAKQVLDASRLTKRYPASSVIEKCFMVCSRKVTIAQSAGKKCSLNSRCRVVEKTSSIHCSLLQERDVLPVQDAERLLERLDLLLAARHAVLVAHTSIHARPVPSP